MAARGHESPMDFSWQGSGPLDPKSPFAQHVMDSKKRNFNAFQSPSKPTLPALREPNSQPFYFSNPPPPSQFRAPSFTTPRKAVDFDFSSGPENSSPAENADSEATPEARQRGDAGSPTKGKKRNSLFNFYGRFAASPGRGDVKNSHGNALAKKIHKRRRKAENFEDQITLRRSSANTSEEDVRPPVPPKDAKSTVHEVGWITGLFTFIHKYPDAPSIIAKYLQVFFNAAILGGCLFMFYSFYATIRADVDRASDEAMAEVLSEMAACSKNYVENRCGADNRLPALESVCSNWELCMSRDPTAVKRARLSAHTFAEILNSFVEPITWKTMGFTTFIVIIGLLVNNATFTLFRRSQQHHDIDAFRHASNPYMQLQQAQFGQYPATPGFQYPQHQLDWENPATEQKRLEYNRSPSKEHRTKSRSPEKRNPS